MIEEEGAGRRPPRWTWLLAVALLAIALLLLWVASYRIDSRGWSFALRALAFLIGVSGPVIMSGVRQRSSS